MATPSQAGADDVAGGVFYRPSPDAYLRSWECRACLFCQAVGDGGDAAVGWGYFCDAAFISFGSFDAFFYRAGAISDFLFVFADSGFVSGRGYTMAGASGILLLGACGRWAGRAVFFDGVCLHRVGCERSVAGLGVVSAMAFADRVESSACAVSGRGNR